MAGDDDIRCVNPEGSAPPGGHYSHAVVAGGFVFVSGQLPVRPDGSHAAQADFATQARQTLANLFAALEAAGTTRNALVKVTVYVTDIADWPLFNTLYAEAMGDHRPARAVVPVPLLHHGYRIEIEAIALACG
ncbi:RidA family protein [Sandarakinorhabdus sp. AAP62]|uniref:RidA family protein n=1 Tax=Sandarakinorhabdus sp. AAP62 TaxID=1248916 RepID=UPI00031086F8|nr:RidA family protein [Sandarakinorhabdus sp. AAP62]